MAKCTKSSKKSLVWMIEQGIEIVFAVIRKNDTILRNICKEANIQTGTEEELQSFFHKNTQVQADYLFSYYWKKISTDTLKIAKKANINFHPGPLPEARGSGYHVAIMDDWGYWGVTAHIIDEEYDTGDIIEYRKFKIPDNIYNIDLVSKAHDALFELFRDIVTDLSAGKTLEKKEQQGGYFYSISEMEKLKYIQADDDTPSIEKKIRAFWHPPFSGAKIILNGRDYTVINDEILLWIENRIQNEEQQ